VHVSRAVFVASYVRRALIKAGLDDKLSSLPLLRPDCVDYRGSPIRRAVRNGIAYDLDLSDYVQWTIYFGIERDEKAALFALAKPGQVVLDIGTNVGEVLMNFAKRVGPEGRVIGFEPNPATLAKCRHNLLLNAFENVELHGVALGDKSGEAFLGHPQAGNAGADRIGSAGIPIKLTTLDEFAAGLDRIDLIKIDVEGFDLKVLRGGKQTLKRLRPKLFVELCDANLREQGDSAAGLVAWLERHGYRIRHVGGGDVMAVPLTPPIS
jgi:FkbM family methyltransferase